jgi:hypothetical protein
VSYEDLHQAGEDKDVAILDLQRAVETARTALETEKKQVQGKLLILLFACWPSLFGNPLPAKFAFLLSGQRTALRVSTTQAQAIQIVYNSS